MDYSIKPARYFSGVRLDFVAAMRDDPAASVLELGCGGGGTGAAALSQGKCARYVGIEMHPPAAAQARLKLSDVVVGDVEMLELPWPEGSFDVLIMSEVLEHLADPWTTVRRLAKLLKPGGLVMASSPNVSHYHVILDLLAGRWDLTESGVMDRTHLRWFTPASYVAMFESAGIAVEKVTPVAPFGGKARLVNALTRSRFQYLFMTQINVFGRRISA